MSVFTEALRKFFMDPELEEVFRLVPFEPTATRILNLLNALLLENKGKVRTLGKNVVYLEWCTSGEKKRINAYQYSDGVIFVFVPNMKKSATITIGSTKYSGGWQYRVMKQIDKHVGSIS